MKAMYGFGLLALALVLVVAGCGGTSDKKGTTSEHAASTPKQVDEAQVKANLAKLDPDDRKLAEAQKLCPISGDPLGEMGPPIKVMVEGQPVLLCCRSCRKDALADPAKTLAKAKELRSSTK